MATSARSAAHRSHGPELEPGPRVLLLEGGAQPASTVGEILPVALGPGTELRRRSSVAEAREDLNSGELECVLLNLSLPDPGGLKALATVRALAPDVPIVVLSDPDHAELAVQAVHEGAEDYLDSRSSDHALLARGVRHAIERKQAELELARRAFHDHLTGLPNRRLLADRLGLALAASERSERVAAVLFLDLDHFRSFNESLGHDVGDSLLRAVARRLAAMVRPSDTAARLGGDEFMVLCPDLNDQWEAIAIAERLSGGLATPLDVDGREVHVSASIGIAFGHSRRARPDLVIRDAERTMYRAKERGSRYELFDQRAGERAIRRPSVKAELDRALERGELRLFYQPELDCTEGRIFGVEALLHWAHPERGTVPPSDFVPAAETSGLIVPIGEWVIHEATRQLAEWRSANLCAPNLTMSVNVSPRQLADRRLPGVVEAALEASDLGPESLCLELTESVIAADPGRMLRRLEELKALGVSLSLDDFGTGISSLSVLSGYPVDMLKVDRSFVARLGGGAKQKRLFASVVGVAHALGLRAVAEGVETRAQLDEVVRVGCDAAQGFYVCPPAVASELHGRLRSSPPHAQV